MVMATDQLPALVATPGDPFAVANVPSDARFESLNREFLSDPELDRMAADLRIHRSRYLSSARDARIVCLWKRKGGKTAGNLTLGKCIKASGLAAFFAAEAESEPVDYIIWLAADNIREEGLLAWQVEALMFHELLHIDQSESKDGETTWTTVGHDAELFVPEIAVYGLWKTDLGRVGTTVEQLRLNGFDTRPGLDNAMNNMRQMRDDLAEQGIAMRFSAEGR